MWKERLEKLIEIIKLWIDITLKRVRDHLLEKYPIEQPVTLLTPDNDLVLGLKSSIKSELSEELKKDFSAELRDIVEQQVSEAVKMLKTPVETETNTLETAEITPIEKTAKNESKVDKKKEKKTPTTFVKKLEKLSIIKNIDEIKEDLIQCENNNKLSNLIIDHLKTSQAPRRYNDLAIILKEQSKDAIQMHIPSVGDLFNRELQELTETRKSTEQNKGKIVKLIRPGLVIKDKVISKALVEVWM